VKIFTFFFPIGNINRGDTLVMNGRHYKIIGVDNASEITIRRTFSQWLRDVIDNAFYNRVLK
jgi:hypothetical protein